MQQKSNLKFSLISLLVIVLCVVFLFVILNSNKKKQYEKKVMPPIENTAVAKKIGAKLYLKEKTGQTSVPVDSPLTMVLYGSSNSQSIVGYDAVIKYDPTVAEFDSVVSLLSDFKTIGVDKKEGLFVTGVKDLNAKNSSVFTDVALAEVTFVPKRPGAVDFTFDFVSGQTNDSNLISDKTADILVSVEGVKIDIK